MSTSTRFRHAVAIPTLAFLALSTSIAQAVPLSELIAGGTIQVDDKLFDDWTYEVIEDNEEVKPDLANIDVIPISAAGDPNPYEPGPGVRFETNGEVTLVKVDPNATGPVSFTAVIGFSVEALDPLHPIKDNLLELTGWTFDNELLGQFAVVGAINIVETVTDEAGVEIASKEVFFDQTLSTTPFSKLLDTRDFDPLSKIFVQKEILLIAHFERDEVSLDSFEQRFSQVPEPTTVALLTLGLAGIGWRRKALS